jgi:hypothetical protein
MGQAQDTYDIPKREYFYSEDTSFVTGDSPATLDINNSLSRNAVDGYIINDGAGDILVEVSADGTNYGGSIRVKQNEVHSLRSLSVDKVRITWVSDSAYRVFAY